MQRLITIFLGLALLYTGGNSQSIPADLVDALSGGKVEKAAAYFHQNLEMTILEKDYMVSKTQATRILKDFFRENPPSAFKVSFEGSKEKSRYAIGTLTTSNGDFRVNLFFMNKQDKRLIYYLTIVKESGYELYPEP